MKIAQVCSLYDPHIGGVETHVKEISERLVEKGFQLKVLTMDIQGKLPKEEVINGVGVVRFKSWSPSESYHFSGELKTYIMKHSGDFDIVHGQGYTSFASLYAAQAKADNRLVLTTHYHEAGGTFTRSMFRSFYKHFGKKIFEKSDKVICVSNYEKNLVMKHFRVDENKVTVIPNGFNMNEFGSLKKRSKDYRVLLCVSRLERYKGIHYLVKALAKLDGDIYLEIVGKGREKKNLAELASRIGVAQRVKFFQDLPRNELLEKYADADIFVLLSEHEAYGISVGEALASGTPCIVLNASALTEWVDNKNCFGISRPVNLEELESLINDVIGKRVEGPRLPDWNETIQELVKVYEDAISTN